MRILYKILDRGSAKGTPSFEVVLKKDEITVENIAELFLYCLKQAKEKRRQLNISFTGETFYQNTEPMLVMLEQFQNNGFKVQLVVDGTLGWQAFYNKCHWLSVEIRTPDWAPFRCNEVRYLWDGMVIMDPLLPENRPFLVLEPQEPTADVFSFLRSSQNIWTVVSGYKFEEERKKEETL